MRTIYQRNDIWVVQTNSGQLSVQLFRVIFPKDVRTRRKEVDPLPAKYLCIELRQRSLKVSILKTYNWLKGTKFIPQNVIN